jgi:hypothetical protein
MAGQLSLSKPGICKEYSLAEATLAHLEDLDLFDSSAGKVVRGERRYPITSSLSATFQLSRAHYASIRNQRVFLFPYQRAIIFYILTSGPIQAYKILSDRGIIYGERPSQNYFSILHKKLIELAPKPLKKWVKGEQEEPDAVNEKVAELYLDILGLVNFWEDPDQVELSFVYDDVLVRVATEGLLCTQAKYEEIADIISAQFDLEVTPADVEIYHKFYFDREIMANDDWNLWIDKLHPRHRNHLTSSLNITLAEYVRQFRVSKSLDTIEELDAMLAVSQQGFWSHKDAASQGSVDAIKKQSMLVNNSLRLFEARMTMVPTDVSTINDRLKLEFEEPKDLRIVNREDFEPTEIDSAKIAQQAGLRDQQAKGQGA